MMFADDEAALTWSPDFMLTAATVPAMGLTILPWARFCWAAVTLAAAASTAAWSATNRADDGEDCAGVCWVEEPVDVDDSSESRVDSALASADWALATFCWARSAVWRSATHCVGAVVLVEDWANVAVDGEEPQLEVAAPNAAWAADRAP